MKHYIEEVKSFLKNKPFVVGYVLLAFIAYGFAMTNPTISMDDLEGDRYTGSGQQMLASGRFGVWFWSLVQGTWANAFFTDVFSLVLLLAALINLCILFKRASWGNIGTDAMTVFAYMVLTYPLIIEIWEFSGSNGHIFGSYLLASCALLLLWDQIHHGSWRKPWRLLPATLMMSLVCAGYESVVAVYIFLVCAVLTLQVMYGNEEEKKLTEVIRQALIYAAMLVAGVILRVLVHKLTLVLLNTPAQMNGATGIYWLKAPVKEVIKELIVGWGFNYVLAAMKYFPLSILLVCGLVFVVGGAVCCKKHGLVLLLPGAGMLLSLVILALVQGIVSPYRTCQVFAVFCGFVLMMVVDTLKKKCQKRTWIRTTALVLAGYLFLFQASYINHFLEVNHRRSEQERFVVQQVGIDLARTADPEKPVIFVGDFGIDPAILEAASIPENSMRWKLYQQLCFQAYELAGGDLQNLTLTRKIPDTSLRSNIDWSMKAFGSQESMLKLFRYYGFEYIPADYDAVFQEASSYAQQTQMPAYPMDGYIEDVGAYIIVHLQQ